MKRVTLFVAVTLMGFAATAQAQMARKKAILDTNRGFIRYGS